MQSIKVKLDKGAYMPERAHADDAGYDIRTPKPFYMFSGSSRDIDTGVHIAIPKGHAGFLKSRSGMNMKYGITGEGVIDSGYTGSIHVKLYNNGMEGRAFEAGDKIIQLVILPIVTPQLVEADSLDETDRGDNGFGSTGR